MKPIKEVYPKSGESDWFDYPYDYKPMLESFGYTLLVKTDAGSYQGDSLVLYQNPEDNTYGILQFGWGSCSGCDALQACKSYDDLKELQESLHSRITWIGNLQETLTYLDKHDWEGDAIWFSEGVPEFLREAKAVLEPLVEKPADQPQEIYWFHEFHYEQPLSEDSSKDKRKNAPRQRKFTSDDGTVIWQVGQNK